MVTTYLRQFVSPDGRQTGVYVPDGSGATPSYGFLHRNPQSRPSQLTLAASWGVDGFYVFFPTGDSGWSTAAAEDQIRSRMSAAADQRFGWFYVDTVRNRYALRSALVVSNLSGGTWTSAARWLLGDSYELEVGRCPIGYDAGTGSIRIVTGPGTGGKITFTGRGATATIKELTELRLLDPAASGSTFAFEFDLGVTDLAGFNVALRLFYPSTDWPGDIDAAPYPLFDTSARLPGLALAARLDPYDLFNESRSGFTFTPAGRARQLQSAYRTDSALPVLLQPEGDAGFVFERRPLSMSDNNDSGDSYLRPTGRFRISAGASTTSARLKGGSRQRQRLKQTRDDIRYRLICGLSGTETVEFVDGAVVTFVRGDAMLDAQRPALTDKAKTSWMAFEAGTRCHVQPEDAAFHSNAGSTGLRGEPATVAYDARPGTWVLGPDTSLPIFPLSGVSPSTRLISRQIEVSALAMRERLIAKCRRERLGKPHRFGVRTGNDQVTTIQGFIGSFSGSGFNTLAFAQSPAGEQRPRQLELHDVSPEFFDVLLHNKLFCVVAVDGLMAAGFDSDIILSDWPFKLKPGPVPGGPANAPTILLFKFGDRTVEQLVDDLTQWEEPDYWTGGRAAEIQAILRQQIGKAVADSSAKYAPFRAAVQKPSWCGILALNCEVVPAELPESARCLVGGLELPLQAHHFGIEVSRVESPDRSTLAMKKSSMFGLIDYDKTDVFFPPHDDVVRDPLAYNFRVAKLQVFFCNSELKSFECRLYFHLPTTFFSPMTKESGPTAPKNIGPNVLVMEGQNIRNGERATYIFTGAASWRFEFGGDSKILRRITVERIQLTTVPSDVSGVVKARFSLWGQLEFADGAAFGIDLFSFERLQFADLGIKATFGSGGTKAFAFDAGDVAFDIAVSRPRPDSFLSRFPLKLKRFLFSPRASFDLGGLGFLPIAPPVPHGGALEPFNFGFLLEIDFGSAGGLLSNSRNLSAEFLLGWRKVTVDEPDALRFGLKFSDFSAGRTEIGIQGILQISVGAVSVRHLAKLELVVLSNCTVDILGRRVPGEGGANVYIIADAATQRVGWYLGYGTQPQGSGVLKLSYLGLGQHIGPPLDASGTVKGALDYMRGLPVQADGGGDLSERNLAQIASIYQADRGWFAGADFSLLKLFDVQLVYNDPALYGLRVATTEWSFDITYRKIRDTVGVFSGDLRLPIPPIDLPPVTCSLPLVGLDLFTTGDFRLNLGFPDNLEFSKSFHIQAGTYTGAGGFYVARLRGTTSTLLPGDYALVLQAGFGLRLGVGASLDLGILQGGVSVCFFGIVEGALGYRTTQVANILSPDALAVRGMIGVIGEMYGTADFPIIKAGFLVRIVAGVGFQWRTGSAVELLVLARVEIHVEVVISIKIFWTRITISLRFSFAAEYRGSWQLGSGGRSLAPLPSVWRQVRRRLGSLPRLRQAPELELFLIPEMTAVGGRLHCVMTMGIACSDAADQGTPANRSPFDLLVQDMVAFLVNPGLRPPAYNQTVTRGRLEELLGQLREPPSYDELTRLLSALRTVVVRKVPGDDARILNLSLFPIIPDLAVRTTGQAGGEVDVKFWDRTPVDDVYAKKLAAFFEEALIRYGDNPQRLRMRTGVASLATAVFRDYFQALLRGAVRELLGRMPVSNVNPMTLDALYRAGDFTRLAGMLSKFFRSGLRVLVPGATRSAPVAGRRIALAKK